MEGEGVAGLFRGAGDRLLQGGADGGGEFLRL